MAKQMLIFTGGGHLNEEGVALYVDALKLERTEELPEEIRIHVAECHECRKEITGLFALLADADYDQATAHPFFTRASARAGWTSREFIRAAAVVAAVAGSAILLYYVTPESSDNDLSSVRHGNTGITGTSDTVTGTVASEAGPSGELLSENFTELPEYEDLVIARLRAVHLQLVSPVVGATVADPVVFQWAPEIHGSVSLEILNNREEVVHSGDVQSLPYAVPKPDSPGLFYWKLIANGELMLVGKFVVKE